MDEEKIKELTEKSKNYSEDLKEVITEIEKEIVGQRELIEKILIAIVANGHILITSEFSLTVRSKIYANPTRRDLSKKSTRSSISSTVYHRSTIHAGRRR